MKIYMAGSSGTTEREEIWYRRYLNRLVSFHIEFYESKKLSKPLTFIFKKGKNNGT